MVYSNGLEKLRSAAGVVYVLFGNGDVKINDLDGTQVGRPRCRLLLCAWPRRTEATRFSPETNECLRCSLAQIYRFKESDTLQYTLKDNTVLNR